MPSPKEVHIDSALTQISIKYRNENYIADKIFPEVKVAKDSDKYFVYGKQNFLLPDTKRAPGTPAKEVDWKIEATPTYSLTEHALQKTITDEERDNADEPINIEADTTEFLTDAIQLSVEKRAATILSDTDNFGGNKTPAKKWDAADSDPLLDVDTAKAVIKRNVGLEANTLVINDEVYRVLKRHPALLEMTKYVKGGKLTLEQLKELFEVKNIYVGDATNNTALEGATPNMASVWPKNCAVLYVAEKASIKKPSYGYTFRNKNFRIVDRWRAEEIASDVIRVRDKLDLHLIDKYCGYLLTAVVA